MKTDDFFRFYGKRILANLNRCCEIEIDIGVMNNLLKNNNNNVDMDINQLKRESLAYFTY